MESVMEEEEMVVIGDILRGSGSGEGDGPTGMKTEVRGGGQE